MRRTLLALTLLLTTALPASAAFPFECCYCTSQTRDNRALLCEALTTSEALDFPAECVAKGGDTYPCTAVASPAACPAVFAGAELICPVQAQAPLLSSTVAIFLAGALAGLGALTLRRRRRLATAL